VNATGGAGAGAPSYATAGELAWRWWNAARIRDYIAAAPGPRVDGEELDAAHALAESVMLGLRSVEGMVAPAGFEEQLRQLEAAGLVVREGRCVRPTRRGLDLHTQVALAVL